MPSFLSSIFGSKPSVPQLPTLDLGTEAAKAASSNLANLPTSEDLVSKTNKFSIDQINQMLESVAPGWSKTRDTIMGNIASEAKGEIPKDVQDVVANSAAARAMGGGYGGSGMHGSLVARDLGLTSLDLTQKGLDSFQSWTRTSAALYEPSMMNLTTMFVSPTQQASWDQTQNVNQFQRAWMESQIEAMPDPVAKGVWDMTLGGIKDLVVGKSGTTNWGGVAAGAASSGGGAAAGGAFNDFGGELSTTGASTTAGSGGL